MFKDVPGSGEFRNGQAFNQDSLTQVLLPAGGHTDGDTTSLRAGAALSRGEGGPGRMLNCARKDQPGKALGHSGKNNKQNNNREPLRARQAAREAPAASGPPPAGPARLRSPAGSHAARRQLTASVR